MKATIIILSECSVDDIIEILKSIDSKESKIKIQGITEGEGLDEKGSPSPKDRPPVS